MLSEREKFASEATVEVKRLVTIRQTLLTSHGNNADTNEICTTRSAINSSVAGYVAGISGVIIGHPFDSAKVWLQTNSIGQNKHFHVTSTALASPTISSPASGNTTSNIGSAVLRSAVPTGAAAAAVPSSASHGAINSANLSTLAANNNMLQNRPLPSIALSTRTLRALYSGVGMPLLTVGLMQSANLTLYDSIRRILYWNDQLRDGSAATAKNQMSYLYNDSIFNVTVAGFCSGGIMAFASAPLILIKTRQQVTGKTFTQTLTDLSLVGSKNSGLKRLSPFVNGFVPHLITESFGRGVYFFVYESSKRTFGRRNASKLCGEDDVHCSTLPVAIHERMISAAIAGIISWTTIFPLDSLRSRIYGQITSNPKNSTEMVRSMYRENGIRGFYRGLGVTALRAGPVAAVVLPIYDVVLEKLSSSS